MPMGQAKIRGHLLPEDRVFDDEEEGELLGL